MARLTGSRALKSVRLKTDLNRLRYDLCLGACFLKVITQCKANPTPSVTCGPPATTYPMHDQPHLASTAYA